MTHQAGRVRKRWACAQRDSLQIAPNQVRAQVCQRLPGCIVNGVRECAAILRRECPVQNRVGHNLQGSCGVGYPSHLFKIDLHNPGICYATRPQEALEAYSCIKGTVH